MCLILQEDDNIFIGADTAASVFKNENTYRISDGMQKLYTINNCIVFCAGNNVVVNNVVSYIKTLENMDIDLISKYLKKNVPKNNTGIYTVELLICMIANGRSAVYQMSEYNSFIPAMHTTTNGNVRILSGGFKTEECCRLATTYTNNKNTVDEIFTNTFNNLACNEIGGSIKVYQISNNFTKLIIDKKIKESNIRYLSELYDIHLLVADVIVGNLVASNKLIVSNDSGSFVVDGSSATMTDCTLTITSDNGKGKVIIDPNSTSVFRVQGNTTGSFVDKLWIDTSGNLNMSGTLTSSVINGGSITGTTISGGSIAIGSGDNVFKADLSGIYLGNASYSSAPFRVSMAGKVTASNVSITGGTLSIGSKFSVDSSGNLTAKDIDVEDGTFSGSITSDATITGGELYGANIYGGAYHDSNGDTSLTLSPTGTWADLIFSRSTGQSMFAVIDNGTVADLTLGGTSVIYCGLNSNTVYAYNYWKFNGSRIGFFGVSPAVRQTATTLPTDGTVANSTICWKINGILTKLEKYGLFDVD